MQKYLTRAATAPPHTSLLAYLVADIMPASSISFKVVPLYIIVHAVVSNNMEETKIEIYV